MAVKVMVAPVIARGEVQAPKPRQAGSKARRRSSVYDADGNEVFITLMCLKCHKMRPLSQFGLRKMADGAIRNQPWCRTCRSGAGTATARKRGEPAAETGSETPKSAVAPAAGEAPAAPQRPVPAGTVAAQVAAAIVWAK